jgi:hypothetical protein
MPAGASTDVEHAALDEPEHGALRIRPVLRFREEPLAGGRRPDVAVVTFEEQVTGLAGEVVEEVVPERVLLVGEGTERLAQGDGSAPA